MRFQFNSFFLSFALLYAHSAVGDVPTNDLVIRILTPRGEHEKIGTLGTEKTPLGSLYKLFIYSYLTETQSLEYPYTCRGNDPEEIFCCQPGESIDRDRALAKSCSPYFKFSRLNVLASDWQSFWKKKSPQAPPWLTEQKQLKPESVVGVNDILKELALIRTQFSAFDKIQRAALGSMLTGTARHALKTWGSTLRVKTFTWRDESTHTRIDEQGFTGGFAGWMADGSSIWVSKAGHGRDAFQKQLEAVVIRHLPTVDSGCVRVRYFDRHPVKSISEEGVKNGFLRVIFKSSNHLDIPNDGTLKIDNKNHQIHISREMSINEYVARVLDREVSSEPLEAARAFAVAIRTYLFQNAKPNGQCLEIADSSHTQRVSPQAPRAESLTVARWSEGLILSRIKNIRYHSTQSSYNRMSWTQAKELAASGFQMAEILKTAYPNGVIDFGEPSEIKCVPHLAATQWIKEQSKFWKRSLLSEPGFESPSSLRVCVSPSGTSRLAVFADFNSGEIYVPLNQSVQDEISILHEYLHMAFRHHPRGIDEVFVEKMAQKLQEKL